MPKLLQGWVAWWCQSDAGEQLVITQKMTLMGFLVVFWEWYRQNVNIHVTPVFTVFTVFWAIDMMLGVGIAIAEKRYQTRKVFKGILKWFVMVGVLLLAWGFRFDGIPSDDIIVTILEVAILFHVGMSVMRNALRALRLLSPDNGEDGLLEKTLGIFEEHANHTLDKLRSSDSIPTNHKSHDGE